MVFNKYTYYAFLLKCSVLIEVVMFFSSTFMHKNKIVIYQFDSWYFDNYVQKQFPPQLEIVTAFVIISPVLPTSNVFSCSSYFTAGSL